MNFRILLCAAALLAWPLVTFAQLDADEGDRENYVLTPSGQVLVVTQPNDDESSLVRRSPGGVDSTIASFGQGLGGGTVDGIGSNPHMNAAGVAAFQACIDVGTDCDSGGDGDGDTSGMFTGTPGSVTTIAVTGDSVNGETICNVEPFPLINSTNQVFWGTTVEGGDGVTTTCDEDGDNGTNGRKAIYRFTPPSTDTLLLLADIQGDGADTVTAVAPFGSLTYDIVDAHLIAYGGDAVTSSGNALVTAFLEDPLCLKGDGASAEDKGISAGDRTALLYVTPTTINLVAMDDNEGTAPCSSSPIGWLGKGTANANGLVMFKGEQEDEDDSPATLNLWTLAGGISELVATGDAVPLGSGTFSGFAPDFDLNSAGAAAFTAGLSLGAGCDEPQPTDGFTSGFSNRDGNGCRGVYYSPDGSSLLEVARNTLAVSLGGAGTNVSADGFEFAAIGSVAVMAENGTVFFVAENQTPDPVCGLPDTGGDQAFGGNGNTRDVNSNDVTGVFAWREGTEPIKLIAEGDVLPQGKVMRLFTPMPELRQHDDGQDNFVVRAWFDSTGNCTPDTEEIVLASAVFPGAIPALGPWGMWLMIGFLAMLGGGRLLQRRR